MRRSEMRSKKKNDIYTFWMCWFSVLKLIFPNDILIMRKRITSLGYELGKENMARCMQCPDCAWRSLSPTIRSKISLGEWIGWKGIEEKGLLIFKYYTQHTDFSLKIVYELYIFYMFNNMGILGFMKTERINILLAVWPKWLHLCVPAIFHYAIDEPLATLSYLSFDLIKFERSFVSGHSSARDRYTMQSCQTMRISSNGSVRWNQIKIDLLCQNVRCEGRRNARTNIRDKAVCDAFKSNFKETGQTTHIRGIRSPFHTLQKCIHPPFAPHFSGSMPK